MRIKQPLRIAVFQGAPWLGAGSAHIAQFLLEETARRTGTYVDVFDIRDLASAMGGTASASELRLVRRMQQTDAIIILAAEHGWHYPTLLQEALSALLKKRVPRAVGFCGMSSGAYSGSQTLPDLLPVVRELGLVAITHDLHFENIHTQYGRGEGREFPLPIGDINVFFEELVWMAGALRDRRDTETRKAFSLFVRPPRPRQNAALQEVAA
jgi:NAD(P)H-dependent FMN reductase